MSKVADKLASAADMFESKNKEYGNAYKKHGAVINSFFPDGLNLSNESDFIRYQIFESIVAKLNRYAQNFKDGGHEDSLIDASVFCAMLQELDDENS